MITLVLAALLAALLVAAGVALLVSAARPDRRSLVDELRVLDGRPAAGARQRRIAVLGLVATAAVVLAPLWAALTGAPWYVVVLAAVATAGVDVALAGELLLLRGRGSVVEAPLTLRWQRRLAVRLARASTATRPVPPLRPVMRARPRPTAAASSRSDIRLLVLRRPADAEGLRMWDLSAQYLGSTLRYRDLLALNHGRSGPGGVPINEDSVIGNGWTVLMPGDARGPGLVKLPRSAGPAIAALPAPGRSDPAPGAVSENAAPAAGVGTIPDDPSPEGATPAPAQHSRAALAWDLVHARLLADGLLDTLDGLRERRAGRRPEGAGVPVPDTAAAAVEESAHVGADVEGGAFLEMALRGLTAGLAQRGTPAPQLVAAHLSDDLLELRLAAPDRHPPTPFEATESGARWLLDRSVPLGDVPDVAPGLPGLVSLGPDRFGRLLLNLPAGGVIALEGDEPGCRMVAAALAVELVVKRWSEAPLVTLVGFGAELADFSPRLRHVERLAQVLDRPVRGDIVILAAPPSDDELTALRVGAGSDWFGSPAVIVIGTDRRARWRLQLGATGTLNCPELDITVGAQALAPATCAALARLAAAERTTELPDVRSSTVQLSGAVDPEAVVVVVGLFGPPRLLRDGNDVPAAPRTVEMVAYLGLLGSSTRDDLAAALWPEGTSAPVLDSALAAAVATLGAGPDGRPLLRAGDERLELDAAVQPDWHLFVAAATRGALGQAHALAAVHDPGTSLRHYAWMARLPLVRRLPGLLADVDARRDRAIAEARARHLPPDRVVIDPPLSGADSVLTSR